MVSFRSVQWPPATTLLLFSIASWLVIVNARQLTGVDDDTIEMVTSSQKFSSSSSSDNVRKEEEGSTAGVERGARGEGLRDVHPFCAFCKGVVDDFQAQLNRPDAVGMAVQTFEEFVCGKLHADGIREKCKEVGEIYIPALINVLRQDMTEDRVCGALKLCDDVDDESDLSSFPQSPIFSSLRHHHHHQHRNQHHLQHRYHPRRKCKLCEAFAAQALRYLSQNATVEEIKAFAHNACKRLKGETTQEECDSLVEVYGEDLPSLVASVTPEEICHFVKFCGDDGNADGAGDQTAIATEKERERDDDEEDEDDGNGVGHGGNECLLCRFAVFEAKKRLQNPQVQEMIMGALDKTCEKAQKHKDQCKAFLDSYGENFFENLDVILDPRGFCKRVGACFSSSSM